MVDFKTTFKGIFRQKMSNTFYIKSNSTKQTIVILDILKSMAFTEKHTTTVKDVEPNYIIIDADQEVYWASDQPCFENAATMFSNINRPLNNIDIEELKNNFSNGK